MKRTVEILSKTRTTAFNVTDKEALSCMRQTAIEFEKWIEDSCWVLRIEKDIYINSKNPKETKTPDELFDIWDQNK